MKELITMWKNTRMIVLTAVTAAVYAALLIPLKPIPIIPGFTEIRPANVIPIVCSLMFGPAAAWGSAIGNTIADAFGTWGPGTFFGFIGNFLLGFIPYKMWRAFGKGEPMAGSHRSAAKSSIIALIVAVVMDVALETTAYYTKFMRDSAYVIVIFGNVIPLPFVLVFAATFVSVFLVLRFLSVRYFLIIFSASAACGLFIGWGVHILGFVPFPALGNIIVINNLAASAILGPILLPVLYPAVKRMGLLYTDVMEEDDLSRPRAWAGVLMIIILVFGLVTGNSMAAAAVGQASFGLSLAPIILLMLIVAAIM